MGERKPRNMKLEIFSKLPRPDEPAGGGGGANIWNGLNSVIETVWLLVGEGIILFVENLQYSVDSCPS